METAYVFLLVIVIVIAILAIVLACVAHCFGIDKRESLKWTALSALILALTVVSIVLYIVFTRG